MMCLFFEAASEKGNTAIPDEGQEGTKDPVEVCVSEACTLGF